MSHSNRRYISFSFINHRAQHSPLATPLQAIILKKVWEKKSRYNFEQHTVSHHKPTVTYCYPAHLEKYLLTTNISGDTKVALPTKKEYPSNDSSQRIDFPINESDVFKLHSETVTMKDAFSKTWQLISIMKFYFSRNKQNNNIVFAKSPATGWKLSRHQPVGLKCLQWIDLTDSYLARVKSVI